MVLTHKYIEGQFFMADELQKSIVNVISFFMFPRGEWVSSFNLGFSFQCIFCACILKGGLYYSLNVFILTETRAGFDSNQVQYVTVADISTTTTKKKVFRYHSIILLFVRRLEEISCWGLAGPHTLPTQHLWPTSNIVCEGEKRIQHKINTRDTLSIFSNRW